jgi:predicted ATP-dependent endonuclease of OLD family
VASGEFMRIYSVRIEGYRSFNEAVTLVCDRRVTVALGANDHGKTNLLDAIRHLNRDHPFDRERDLNWDSQDNPHELPSIKAYLSLDEQDQTEARHLIERSAYLRLASENYRVARDSFETAVRQVEMAATEFRKLEAESKKLSLPIDTNDLEATINAIALGTEGIALAQQLTETRKLRAALDKSIPEKRDELLEAIISRVEAPTFPTSVNSTKGASEALSSAEAALSEATARHQHLVGQLNTARTTLEQAQAAGDAAATQQAQAAVATLDSQVVAAIKAITELSFGGLLKDALEHFTSGKYKGLLKSRFATESNIMAPTRIGAERVGVGGQLQLVLASEIDTPELRALFESRLPRVELIGPVEKLADFVTRADIEKDEFAFMRGVFYYAGLDKGAWETIFEQSDRTARQLEIASERLNTALQESWSQGRELRFKLQHSSGGKIELYILDPVVKDRYVRTSRRSTGFTHFFTLKTILHSRQTEAPASSYIWLFDEPGLYLHPSGQQDLLQVLETLASSNQTIYSTHSLFLINKNYPARHQLLIKERDGTRVDGKPFHGQWRSAIDALGLALPGTILFASKVLLVEGDSDPILLNAILIKLIEMGRLNADLNMLSIISTGNSRNADALIRFLSETPSRPRLAALFDGDDGGRARQADLARVMEHFKVTNQCLREGTTLEDHLLGVKQLFVPALGAYVSKLIDGEPDELHDKIVDSFGSTFAGIEPDGLAGVAAWSRSIGKEIGNLRSDPSPVGIAREYSLLLVDCEPSLFAEEDLKRARALSDWVMRSLDLPEQVLAQEAILETA